MEYNRTDIRNIAFEKINDRFSKGKYLGIEVTMDMTTGYINGPHLVGQVKTKGGLSKQFTEWKRSKEAYEIIEYLTLEISAVALIIDITDAPNGLRGAYIHPRLVAHVAQWASPIFADKVAIIINDKAINDAIADKNVEIRSLKDEIDEMKRILNENLIESRAIREENNMVLQQLDTITSELENTSISNEELVTKADNQTTIINTIAAKLDIATEQRVPPARHVHSNEVFAIYRNPITSAFYMIRRQKKTVTTAIANCSRSGYTERFYYSDSPNAVNLGIRIKDIMPKTLAEVSGTIIKLAPGKLPTDLLTYIVQIEQEKKNL